MRSIKNCYNFPKDPTTSNIQFVFRLLGFLLGREICIRFPSESLLLTSNPHTSCYRGGRGGPNNNGQRISHVVYSLTFPLPYPAEVEIYIQLAATAESFRNRISAQTFRLFTSRGRMTNDHSPLFKISRLRHAIKGKVEIVVRVKPFDSS